MKRWILPVLCSLLLYSPVHAAVIYGGGSGSGLPAGGDVNDCLINTAPGSGDWTPCPGAAGGDSVSVDGAAVVDPNFDSAGDIDFVNTANVITANVKANSVALGTDTTGGYAASATEGGPATTALALDANPTDCAANNFATTIDANGNLTCAQPAIVAGTTGTLTIARGGTNATSFTGSKCIESSADGLSFVSASDPCGSGGGLASTDIDTSAELAAIVTDETGSGPLVFRNAPTLDALVITTSMLIPNDTAVPGTCTIGMLFFDNNASAGVNLYGCTASNTWTLLGDGGGAGSVATDTIWDVAGDLVYGTGSNTAARLGIGTANQILQTNAGATAPEWTSTLAGLTSINFGSNPADAGRLRLSNNESLCWEAATPGTDLCLTLNASDEFEINAPLNITSAAGAQLLTGVTSPSAPAGAEQWYFYADSVDNLPKYIYNGESEQTFFTTANPQTTASTPSANDNDTSIATTAYVQTELTAYASDTVTFTNKTLDAEGTGNVLTIPRRIWLPAAGCDNTTPGSIWDLPTSSPAVAACVTGTNTQKGVLDFADSANLSAQLTYALPTTWTGTVDARIKWFTTATSGDVVLQLSTICVGDAETDDPAFNTASTVTDTAKGTANQTNDASITTVTVTGCAPGELLHIKIQRDSAHASDTLAATARLIGVELTIREAL